MYILVSIDFLYPRALLIRALATIKSYSAKLFCCFEKPMLVQSIGTIVVIFAWGFEIYIFIIMISRPI